MSWLLAGAIALSVQAAQATVSGYVRETRGGEPIAGVVVTLPDLGRSVVTGAEGRYVFREVPAGPQHLEVRTLGYGERTMHALVPSRGRLHIDIWLRPQPIQLPPIDVASRLTLDGASTVDSARFADRHLEMSALSHHPRLAAPDVLQALHGGVVFVEPESPTGVHVRGGAADQTAYVIDGVPVISPYHAAGLFSAWNAEALSSVRVASSWASPALPDALSGVIEASTRAPTDRLRARGSVTTTQASVTVDGPLGPSAAGFLLSLRSGIPDAFAPRGEASYVLGETADVLAKVEGPILGGRGRVLVYDNDNELDTAARANLPDPTVNEQRNTFEWTGQSIGGAWTRHLSKLSVTLRAWHAAAGASARWLREDQTRTRLLSDRRANGFVATVERPDSNARTAIGIRLEWHRSSYRVSSTDAGAAAPTYSSRTRLGTVFIEHARDLGSRVRLDLATSLTAADNQRARLSPRARLLWRPIASLVLTASHARLHQYAQSLRNAESVVGAVFPAELYVGSGPTGVPVARGNQSILAADWQPISGIRVGVQAYTRGLTGLALVAPRSGEPFSTGDFARGAGTARGFAIEGEWTGATFGVNASYGLQRVRYTYNDSSYVPDHASRHIFDAGVVVFPSATFSVRTGLTAALGRRAAAVPGEIEWESCNILDQGCEFAGSPHYGDSTLDATSLPAYLRLDASVRKHWHFDVLGRDVQLALFGTVVNLTGQRNVLTFARDPETGEAVEVELLPRSPLMVGFDWRF